MTDQIQILRGTRQEIVEAATGTTLLEGQPLYNETDNYLTIGSSGNTSPTQQPIAARDIHGYFTDKDSITAATGASYHVGPTATDSLEIKSDKGNIDVISTGSVNIAGNNSVTITGPSSVSLNATAGPVVINSKTFNLGLTGTSNVLNMGATSFELKAFTGVHADVRLPGLTIQAAQTGGERRVMIASLTATGQNVVWIGENGDSTGDEFDVSTSSYTRIFNIDHVTSFNPLIAGSTGSIYTIPSGTDYIVDSDNKVNIIKATGNIGETSIASIIYNIGQRLDSLGFKKGCMVDNQIQATALLFSKIGTLVQIATQHLMDVGGSVEKFTYDVPAYCRITGAVEDITPLVKIDDLQISYVSATTPYIQIEATTKHRIGAGTTFSYFIKDMS